MGPFVPVMQVRQLSWLIQTVGEIYDGRQAFETVDRGAGRRGKLPTVDKLMPGEWRLVGPWQQPSSVAWHVSHGGVTFKVWVEGRPVGGAPCLCVCTPMPWCAAQMGAVLHGPTLQ